MPTDEFYMTHGDPRASGYPFMESPKATLIFTLAYLVFVKLIGPAFMKERPAFQAKVPMAIYNFCLVLLSTWVFTNILWRWITKYDLRCEPVDYSNDEDALKILRVCYVFYISKLVEFIDTVFFILRKKDSQVTKLHVLHHALTPLTLWYSVKYGAGGYNTFYMMLNSFVHIWMYLYYLLAGMGPGIQKYLWWKKYLTSLQLVQFVAGFLYCGSLELFASKYCKASPFLVRIVICESVLYFALFMNFYKNAYKKKHQK